MGLVTLLLLVFNTCVTRLNYFVAVTAYPFYFTFSFLIFMCGVLLLVNHYQRGSRWNPVWAGLLFFVSALFYENYVVFILLVALYVFLRHWRRDGITHLWRSATFWRELAPMVLSAVSSLPDLFCSLSALDFDEASGTFKGIALASYRLLLQPQPLGRFSEMPKTSQYEPGGRMGAGQGRTESRGLWACPFGGWSSP
jgi:hypothetical protein